MQFNKKAFIIVDAYTTGRFLAPYLNANGYSCIHVQSREDVISVYMATFTRENFIENLIYKGNIQDIISQLKPYDIKAVIPGAETGVLLSDELNETLKLPTSNGTKSSLARRDKYQMIQKLAEHNIPHAKSFKSNNLDDILGCARKWDIYPVVIKPLSSSGSFGVSICMNEDDIINGFNDILDNGNVFNEKNTDILLQQFLVGQEYIVNTVSYEGTHKVSDIWRKFKRITDGAPINDYAEIVSVKEPVYADLSAYVSTVLDALNIKFGAGHSELIMTVDGPILIETAARLAGSIDPSAVSEALGSNQVADLLMSYINPNEFLKKVDYPPRKYSRHVFFASTVAGYANNPPDLAPIMNLQSFHSLSFRFDKGCEIVKTVTLADFPGYCYLASDDHEQLQKDFIQFRQLEKDVYLNMINNGTALLYSSMQTS